MIHIQYGNELVCNANLYVICRQQLAVPHVVLFQVHEGGGRIRFGVAVPLFSTDIQLFPIRFKLTHIRLKLLVMPLRNRFVPAFAMNKAVRIQLIYPGVCLKHLFQVFRHIFLIGFYPKAVPAELHVDLVQQRRDLCIQAITGSFRRLFPHPGVLVGIGFQLCPVDVEVRQIHMALPEDLLINILEDLLDLVRQYFVDEIAESAIGRRFPVHEIHVPDVHLAIIL